MIIVALIYHIILLKWIIYNCNKYLSNSNIPLFLISLFFVEELLLIFFSICWACISKNKFKVQYLLLIRYIDNI